MYLYLDLIFRNILILISLIETILCDCGLPGIPTNAKIDSFEFIYSEESQIEYYCELPELVLLNGRTRVCKNGKWVGAIPFCAEEIGENSIDQIQISDRRGKRENNSNPIKSRDGKAFSGTLEKGECISSRGGSLKPITFLILLHKQYLHISYFEVVFHTAKAINSSDILLEALLIQNRVCSVSVGQPSVAPSYLLRLKFICDFVTNTDDETEYVYYTDDMIQNITLKLDSNSLSICEIRLFYQRFNSPHRCGSPDMPTHSSVDLVEFGSKYGAMPNYQFTCDRNYELLGNREVRCGINNRWLDEFPACVPKVKCPVPPEAPNSEMITIRQFYINFETYNGNVTAIVGSQVIYTCDDSQNSQKIMIGDSIRVCTETGQWSGIQPYCLDLSELKVDKYKEVFDQKVINETKVENRYQNESTDCGFPAMPMYAKPSPSRWMSEDIRSHYQNGSKIQFRCESAFHYMYSQTKVRKCVDRKWTGQVGKCETNHGGSLQLSSILVANYSRVISLWPRPEPNETNITTTNYFDQSAYGNWDGTCDAPFNITAKQQIILKLNDTQPISSFLIEIKPGGLYGGYSSYGNKNNVSIKPLVAKIGTTVCTAETIYDYPPHSTHLVFICDNEYSASDYSVSVGIDEILVYVYPDQFDKKFDPKNVSLCSLMLFHSSKNCGIPDRPLNSFVRIDNQIAYYSCEEGFELIGDSQVMCLPNGKWSREFPICKIKPDLCPKAPSDLGVLEQYTNTANNTIVMGTLVNYQCFPTIPGFEGRPLLVGSRTRICLYNGQWSGSKPFCIDSSKYQGNNMESFSLSTKALIIISVVSVSTIIVIILIVLIVVFHLTQKCYECCSLCLKRHSTERQKAEQSSDVIENKISVRPQSRVDINEINETLNKLANFNFDDHQKDVQANPIDSNA